MMKIIDIVEKARKEEATMHILEVTSDHELTFKFCFIKICTVLDVQNKESYNRQIHLETRYEYVKKLYLYVTAPYFSLSNDNSYSNSFNNIATDPADDYYKWLACLFHT
eukprot:TRINITY_DN115836_c0_g1_i1.p1 TRINITY_DN115836_c0_g1~~TRINITY_DN115836_c0_g1_i1.p1  ORF type:complete len:109 (-),score=0.64 TRINITY_DN115836_c0_g1_i1:57-383(-)